MVETVTDKSAIVLEPVAVQSCELMVFHTGDLENKVKWNDTLMSSKEKSC